MDYAEPWLPKRHGFSGWRNNGLMNWAEPVRWRRKLKTKRTIPDPVRSRTMRAVKSKNTGIELEFRRILHSHGMRYRLHSSDLPGKPDIVFRKARVAVFIHGCFWHQHHCARGSRVPKTNQNYWKPKLERNAARDRAAVAKLRMEGWRAIVVWECQRPRFKAIAERVQRLVTQRQPSSSIR